MNRPEVINAADGEIVLEARDITRSFKMADHTLDVLKGVSLTIKKGEMVGIVGVSGSGKSTLLHILGTLDKPTSGTLRFSGEEVLRLGERRLADFRSRRIGFVFQSHHLLPEFTALENVMLPALIAKRDKKEAAREAERLLHEVGLTERIQHTPGKMSGGEQQRVALARALMNKPDIVLADEPTGNLDSITGETIHDLLRRLNRTLGQVFVIVTHNEKLVKQMDWFIRLADGRIVY